MKLKSPFLNHLRNMKKIIFVVLMLAVGCLPSFSNIFHPSGDCDTCITMDKKDAVEELLIGEWSFTGYAFEIIDKIHDCEDFITSEGAFLTFEFHSNGTYTKKYGNKLSIFIFLI